MSEVLDHFTQGGTRKLALLCLADYADDAGGNCYPSMRTIAKRCCCSESQARRHVHALIKAGYISVEPGTEQGGGGSRRYKIKADRLTPCTHATPSTNARGSTHARRPLAPMRETPCTHDTRSIINHQGTGSAAPDGAPPNDLKATIWTLGVDILCRAGKSEREARSFLGKCAKADESKLAELIGRLAANPKIEPVEYIAKAMQPRQQGFVV